ncbi:MAG TPA: division/cell wall cluster transcriptional repressor MraZ [Candidatus Binataceae bacterium]|nr:division/cell wall cluster transcriptional repressor MraZ [Candidatus Binataceae bacterium]
MLSGRHDLALDEKGRITLPVRFRDVFRSDDHNFPYITNHLYAHERCLALYSHSEWMRLIDRVENKERFDPDVQRFRIFYIGGAHEVELDKQGRILIPPDLREFARLDREVTFTGQLDHFALWDRAALRRVLQQTEEELISNPGMFSKLGL